MQGKDTRENRKQEKILQKFFLWKSDRRPQKGGDFDLTVKLQKISTCGDSKRRIWKEKIGFDQY